jgi:hypothetical protein
MPRVVTAATATLAAAGLSDRTTVEGGDFFDAVPAADIYVLSAVLHDWDDASALRILRNIADATDQNTHLILVEIVVPEDDALHAANVDITMMTMVGGRERTESQ